jgi:hypothetical protein
MPANNITNYIAANYPKLLVLVTLMGLTIYSPVTTIDMYNNVGSS